MTLYKKLGFIFAGIGGFFWSISGVCGQFLFEQKGWTAEGLIPLRLLFAGFILTVFSLIISPGKTLSLFKNVKTFFSLLIFSIFGITMCQYTFFKGISLSNAAIVTAIQYTAPALIIVYLALAKHKKPTTADIISVIMAILGTYVLSTHLNPAKLTISTSAFIYALLSMITLAIYTLQPAKLLKEFGSIPVTGVGMLIGGILMNIFMPPVKGIGTIDLSAICAFLGVAVLGSVFSFTMFLEGTKRIGPAKTSLLSAIEPVGSTILCIIFMNVTFTSYDFIGIILIVSTVFISYFSEKE